MKLFGWYSRRGYPHFDLPLSAEQARALVEDPVRVSKHAFFPFLAFDIKSRKHKRVGNRRTVKAKSRPIRVASHVDGYIFAYYAYLLGRAYEAKIAGTALAECVLAYRKNLGSNVDFAKAAFEEIEKRDRCVAIAMDIESFFESLSHEHLKLQWKSVLDAPKLTADHFAVYRAVTRYSVVDRDKCFKILGVDADNAPRPICDARTFRDVIRGKWHLVMPHVGDCGVPQGSQISALLSNIYMRPFDEGMVALAIRLGGYYRRYSDDILFVCNPEDERVVCEETQALLTAIGSSLVINASKNLVSQFRRDANGVLKCTSAPIQYLGFTFDGQRKLLRSGTVSKYWRGMIYAARGVKYQAKKAARTGGNPTPFKRSLYRQYTHLGKSRNFVQYAYDAARKLGSSKIRQQIKGHWERLQSELRKP